MQQQPWQRPWRPPRLKRASLPYYFLSDYALWRRPKNSPLLIHTTYFTCFWSERWPQRYLWTTEGRLQRAVATWRAWTCSPLLCSGSSSSRNAAAATDGCCNHHQAGGVWGRVGEPSEGLPAREHRYSIAASTLSYPLLLLRSKRGTKLTEPWGGRNNPLLPCMSDAASTKRHLATLLSCTIINRHLKISFSCSCQ